MSPTREHLLGYLLGALEPVEREQVERELDQSPALRTELARLESCFGRIGLSAQPAQYDAPAGLAARTCHFVALEAEASLVSASPAGRPVFTTPTRDEYLAARRSTWADFVVAAAVLIAGFALFFPALSHSRFQAQIAMCQNHLRQLGFALHEHAALDEYNRFPWIETEGNRNTAGIYAPTLVGQQLVVDPRMFGCPSSPTTLQQMEIPSPEQLDAAEGELLQRLKRTMGGDYGYNMGYTKDGRLVATRDARRSRYPLLGDKPSDQQPGRRSANHEGRGQNILCEDGSVNWCPTVPSAHVSDDPFHNREGEVAAGVDRDDAVLGGSADSPLPVRLIRE